MHVHEARPRRSPSSALAGCTLNWAAHAPSSATASRRDVQPPGTSAPAALAARSAAIANDVFIRDPSTSVASAKFP